MANLERTIGNSLRNVTFSDLPSVADARKVYGAIRGAHGFTPQPGLFLSEPDAIAKYGEGEGRAIYGMALAPHRASQWNACAFEDSCADPCVAGAGNGGFSSTQRARIVRTELWAEHPKVALALLVGGLDKAIAKWGATNVAARLNTFSDVRWERVLPAWFWTRFGLVKFYDYTKHPLRSRPELPGNYSLSYSVSPRSTKAEVARQRAAGRSVAVVVETRGGKLRDGSKRPLPTVMSATVVDGDTDDRRYADPPGAIVMLRRKGTLKAGDPLVRDPRSIL